MSRVVVVGAGIVGAACAYYAARAEWDVVVIERDQVASGTTSRGEGNLLVSDKGAGPELDLMRLSRRLWLELADELGRDELELDEKGGLVVASMPDSLAALTEFAEGQRSAGVVAQPVEDLRSLEPQLAPGLAGGVFYPEDLQVQPVLATQALLAAAIARGAELRCGTEVLGFTSGGGGDRPIGRPLRLRLGDGSTIDADAVVNAAGPWGSLLGDAFAAPVPVLPRRGFVLVTAPVGPRVRHKVYAADYVANVSSGDAGLQTSCVVEGTRGGTILIGASRERVGFDDTLDPLVVRRLAAQACALFPFLREVPLMRTYRGFRPYCPDHLPVIGPDRRVPGLVHAVGHEGAGIGLAPATGHLVTAMISGALRSRRDPRSPDVLDGVDARAFAPERFASAVTS